MIDVIYLMGGIGKRAKLGYPKQFVYLGGRQLFLHGLETILRVEGIQNIIIVTSDILKTYKSLNANFGYADDKNVDERVNSISVPYFFGKGKNLVIIKNGDTRQDSVKKGLDHVTTDFVLISEAVRPFITLELTKLVIDTKGDIVTPVSNLKSTVIDKSKLTSVNRENFGEVQMPQKFNYQILKNVSLFADDQLYTDSCDLICSTLKESLTIVEGIEENIKITTPLDLEIMEAIYNRKKVGSYE